MPVQRISSRSPMPSARVAALPSPNLIAGGRPRVAEVHCPRCPSSCPISLLDIVRQSARKAKIHFIRTRFSWVLLPWGNVLCGLALFGQSGWLFASDNVSAAARHGGQVCVFWPGARSNATPSAHAWRRSRPSCRELPDQLNVLAQVRHARAVIRLRRMIEGRRARIAHEFHHHAH